MAAPPAESVTSGNTEEDWHVFEVLCKDMNIVSTPNIFTGHQSSSCFNFFGGTPYLRLSNKQKYHFWSENDSHKIRKKSLHSAKMTVWCDLNFFKIRKEMRLQISNFIFDVTLFKGNRNHS